MIIKAYPTSVNKQVSKRVTHFSCIASHIPSSLMTVASTNVHGVEPCSVKFKIFFTVQLSKKITLTYRTKKKTTSNLCHLTFAERGEKGVDGVFLGVGIVGIAVRVVVSVVLGRREGKG